MEISNDQCYLVSTGKQYISTGYRCLFTIQVSRKVLVMEKTLPATCNFCFFAKTSVGSRHKLKTKLDQFMNQKVYKVDTWIYIYIYTYTSKVNGVFVSYAMQNISRIFPGFYLIAIGVLVCYTPTHYHSMRPSSGDSCDPQIYKHRSKSWEILVVGFALGISIYK